MHRLYYMHKVKYSFLIFGFVLFFCEPQTQLTPLSIKVGKISTKHGSKLSITFTWNTGRNFVLIKLRSFGSYTYVTLDSVKIYSHSLPLNGAVIQPF